MLKIYRHIKEHIAKAPETGGVGATGYPVLNRVLVLPI